AVPLTPAIPPNSGDRSLVIGGTSVTLAPEQTAFADTTPPTTSATRAPAPNANGWNNSDVTVTLDATDNASGAGVKEIRYVLSGAETKNDAVTGHAVSLTLSREGETTVTYFAVDNAGNVEPSRSFTVKIDKTA